MSSRSLSKKLAEMLGFALEFRLAPLGELVEWFDLYQQLLALKFVRPDACDRAIDQHHGRDPALVAVDALVVLRAQQVVFFAMS